MMQVMKNRFDRDACGQYDGTQTEGRSEHKSY